MIKFIVFCVFQILNVCDSIIFYLFKRKIFHYIYELLRSVSYTKINVKKKIVSFFAPNSLIQWRVNTFYSKEPETLEWIDNFSKSNIIFWDIGANIGLYSIYAALKHKNIAVICFEASSNNLGILTRNVSINKLTHKILINPFPLSNKENKYLLMNFYKFL